MQKKTRHDDKCIENLFLFFKLYLDVYDKEKVFCVCVCAVCVALRCLALTGWRTQICISMDIQLKETDGGWLDGEETRRN